jgi:hypothetical protein
MSLETMNNTTIKRTQASGAFDETIPALVESQSSVNVTSESPQRIGSKQPTLGTLDFVCETRNIWTN